MSSTALPRSPGRSSGDKLAGRIYAVKRKRDGLYDVSTGGGPRTDNEDADRDLTPCARSFCCGSPTLFQARLIADYSRPRGELLPRHADQRWRQRAAHRRARNGCGRRQSRAAVRAPRFRRSLDRAEYRDKGVAVDFNWDLPLGTLTSISAWREWENMQWPGCRLHHGRRLFRAAGRPVRQRVQAAQPGAAARRARTAASTGWSARSTRPRISMPA